MENQRLEQPRGDVSTKSLICTTTGYSLLITNLTALESTTTPRNLIPQTSPPPTPHGEYNSTGPACAFPPAKLGAPFPVTGSSAIFSSRSPLISWIGATPVAVAVGAARPFSAMYAYRSLGDCGERAYSSASPENWDESAAAVA